MAPKFCQFLVSFISTYPENVINSDQILNNFKLLAACLEGNPLTRYSYFKRILDGTNIYNRPKFDISKFNGRGLDRIRKKNLEKNNNELSNSGSRASPKPKWLIICLETANIFHQFSFLIKIYRFKVSTFSCFWPLKLRSHNRVSPKLVCN